MLDVTQSLKGNLNVDFQVRESSYRGGEYFLHRGAAGLEISVETHACDEDGEYAEPAFTEYETLVYVNNSNPEVEGKMAAVTGLELLRTETV
ncbi:hypothetical protein [Streptomyces sp. NPDC049915]|uniref:hypothetical protein n=1 Tax=Streptomyces sp. NPDC049915 TaxID=3155510 RepID=UPI0034218A99